MLSRPSTKWLSRVALSCSLATWLLVAGSIPPRADDAAAEIVEPSPRDAFLDPAFDLFVSQQMLEQAVASGDAAMLTDVALQVAHGEDVLQRPRQGVGAKVLMPAAISAAANDGDKDLLKRLQQAVTRYGMADLEPIVATALQLADSERKLDMPPGMDPSEATAESIVIYNAMAKEIRKALHYGNRGDVEDIVASLPQLPLHKKQRDHLAKLADQALVAINAKTEDNPLSLLASASRTFPKPPVPGASPPFVRSIVGPSKLKSGTTGQYTVILNRPAAADYVVTIGYVNLSGPTTVGFKKGTASASISVAAPKIPAHVVRMLLSGSITVKLATCKVSITP